MRFVKFSQPYFPMLKILCVLILVRTSYIVVFLYSSMSLPHTPPSAQSHILESTPLNTTTRFIYMIIIS